MYDPEIDCEGVGAVSLLEHTYQASDLAGVTRREFLDRARAGGARLRDTDGTPLVMLPEQDLSHIRVLAAWMRTYLALETAMGRTHQQRAPSDFGDVAWAIALDEEDLCEFRAELRDALVLASSRKDVASLLALVRDWQFTADALTDPVGGPILRGGYGDEDFVDAPEPQLAIGP